MPARKTQQKVRDYLKKYGYDFQEKDVQGNPVKQTYKNNFTPMNLVNLRTGELERITLKTFRNRVNRGNYTVYSPENDINRIGLSSKQVVHKSSFDRWLDHQDRYVATSSPQEQRKIYNDMQTNIKMLTRKKNYSLGNINNKESFKALIEAFKVVGPRLGNKEIHLTFYDKDGHKYYRILNEYTVAYMEEMIYFDNFDIRDSFDDFVHSINEIQKIDIEFNVKKPGKRINAGFFPYINKTNIDLRKYGIFGDISDEGINESCLIQAFKSSGILTDTELNMLQNFVKTRTVPQAILNNISALFKLHINCKIYYGADRNSHVDYGGEFKEDRSIKLIIINSHYILNERTNITEFYIRKYEEINNDSRFKNHPRKTLLQKFDGKRYAFAKQGIKIQKLIQKMIEKKMLVPMTEQQINKLEWLFYRPLLCKWSFRPSSNGSFEGFSRPIIIADKKMNYYKKTHKILQTKHFFGYEPEPNEVEYRLNELQKIVDSLSLRRQIDVSLYYKFSELFQKIMYEYGCFDGVLEFCGNKAKNIRDECIFPHSHTYNDKPLYLNKKLYYIDLNSAYLSAITNIPKGEDFVEKNTKIKELIDTLYDIRLKAKKNGNTKLATTLKFLINSCYGYSIRRPKNIKHKYTNNVDNYIETFAPYVVGYNYVNESAGYVSTVNSFVPHFTHPQFAREILDNFNKKMEEISRIVKVYYYNIDSVLIDESDFNKLVRLRYVGDKLGDFKIEHVFTEIAIKSQKQFVATTESGEKIFHCVRGVDYEEFVNDVKKML